MTYGLIYHGNFRQNDDEVGRLVCLPQVQHDISTRAILEESVYNASINQVDDSHYNQAPHRD